MITLKIHYPLHLTWINKHILVNPYMSIGGPLSQYFKANFLSKLPSNYLHLCW